ncbi:carboxypeptidase-like regulatory domain-containing protein [Marinirhabdus gelatinilytica]|uniref:Carboxypeptidase-like protein n=1 Tax=Marinirhabdus gelatinilytica TaxID=1703343 RepID=A0A370QK17_9FLAO|nr:carboxypeptidase-like regulatory domain-containing protein [Marinirhabdus gelatinilytica]RDK88715.1 carboxypeptidase-like protein [Marinirhabdus gelatinilytica]
MKNFFTALALFLLGSASLFAQEAVVKGKVIDSDATEPVPDTEIRILSSIFNTETDAQGMFSISGTDLPQGEQVLVVSKAGYVTKRIPITIQNGTTINLDPILFEVDLSDIEAQIGIISLSDNELNQDEGTAFNISGLLQASRDVFLNAAAFDFSATFFRPRGLDNANGKVLINGVEMNKQFNGRPQWGNWGGLNDVQRNRDFSMGLTANEYTFGDVAGTTNIIMRASQERQGGRVSYASSNRSYRGRIMGTYNSGLLASGWAYSVSVSRRYGEEGYQDGTLYDANSFYASVEKKLNDAHSLNFSAFYTPNRRGRSTAITQEARDLKGIRYNPNWGFQDGEIRNSRVRNIEEPVFLLNHYWDISEKTRLNTNIGFQTGSIGNTRIDNGGTRLVTVNGQEAYLGGARNPFGNYYQRLPSFFLQDENPTAFDYQQAYLAQQEFINDGQLDWSELYAANTNPTNVANGGNSIYAIQEDRNDDTQITFNSILSSQISENITLNGNINYRTLKSENYALLKDLLGGTGYLDVDFFAEDDVNIIVGDIAQSDLRNRNRIVQEGERYKYNYELMANVLSGFAQAQFKYNKIDFYVGASAGNTTYQRNGLYENGNFPGARSFGESEELSFTNYGIKGGATYKVTGRHLIDLNAGYLTKAPTLRNSFSNARQTNDVIVGLEEEKIQNLDLSYIYRSPIVKARLTGFYIGQADATDLGFYFTENLTGLGGPEESAFVQEVLTGIETRNMGVEMGIEAQVTPTVKLKGAASVGQYVYTNNPNLYLTSDDFDGNLTFGDGTTKLENYHVAGGPERAYQLGFEYRDPDFWWFGATTNYFSNAYIDVNNLARTTNFSQDFDGQTFIEYSEDEARELLTQEEFDDYFLVNVVGGKSWKIDDYYVGFFATINNILNQNYKTGGFEQGRLTNFRDIKEDASRENGRIFGPRYFFGYGTTYYVNLYVRF